MLTDRKAVARNVRAEMARRSVTQAQLADVLGLRTSAVSRRIMAETPFDVDELILIARYLDVSIPDLLQGVPNLP